MIFNKTKTCIFSIVLVLIVTLSMISCSNTYDINIDDLNYKKDVGTSISEEFAVYFLKVVSHALYLYNQIENRTFTHENNEAEKTIDNVVSVCTAITESYRDKGLSQHEIEEHKDWQMCNSALDFLMSQQEFLISDASLVKYKAFLEKNIGNISEQDIVNTERNKEEKKEEVKRKLEFLLAYFEQ